MECWENPAAGRVVLVSLCKRPVVWHNANALSGTMEIINSMAVCVCWVPSSCHELQDQGVSVSCCKSAPKGSEPHWPPLGYESRGAHLWESFLSPLAFSERNKSIPWIQSVSGSHIALRIWQAGSVEPQELALTVCWYSWIYCLFGIFQPWQQHLPEKTKTQDLEGINFLLLIFFYFIFYFFNVHNWSDVAICIVCICGFCGYFGFVVVVGFLLLFFFLLLLLLFKHF